MPHVSPWRPASAGLALFALAVNLSPATVRADDVEKGRDLAMRLCATCHLNADQGEKTGPHGIPGFTAVARRPGQSVEGIVEWLRSVPPMMPNHHLSQDEMMALAAYILSLADEPGK